MRLEIEILDEKKESIKLILSSIKSITKIRDTKQDIETIVKQIESYHTAKLNIFYFYTYLLMETTK